MSDAPGQSPTSGTPACPACGQPVAADSETYPFCSQRCRLVDLGRWLDDKYRINEALDPLD